MLSSGSTIQIWIWDDYYFIGLLPRDWWGTWPGQCVFILKVLWRCKGQASERRINPLPPSVFKRDLLSNPGKVDHGQTHFLRIGDPSTQIQPPGASQSPNLNRLLLSVISSRPGSSVKDSRLFGSPVPELHGKKFQVDDWPNQSTDRSQKEPIGPWEKDLTEVGRNNLGTSVERPPL